MAATKSGPAAPFSQEQIDDALMALIAWAGNASAAVRHLKSVGKRAPRVETLLNWSRTLHWERYQELREKYGDQIEKGLAADYLDSARELREVAHMAAEKAKERLEAGEDQDPGRTAANLARASAIALEKSLTLQGKPTQITESRNPSEILAGLIARHPQIFGLAEPAVDAPQIEEVTGA